MPATLAPSAAVAELEPELKNRRVTKRRPHVASVRVACPTARPRPSHLPADADFCPYDSREATSVNVSRHGLCLTIDRPLPIGAFQVVELCIGGSEVRSEVRITRCEPIDEGTYEVGAIFC